ncbi:MAG: Bro-N domain-containing protein [Firmicutes bacterium]|nr:Bro-N domain-containing protein [Bacillota bacterium]
MEGEPWFAARDVCDVLEIQQVVRAVERLDEDEKGMSLIHTLGGNQETTIVNEPGLYRLIMGSRKPEAREFKRWVVHEVRQRLQTGFTGPARYQDRRSGES